jgi:imidazolonepropionase-like amidohydrolase
MSKAKAISRITKESAEIIGANDLGQIKPGIISSHIIWNGDPFSLDSYLSRQLQREKLYIRNSYFNFKT